MGRPYTLDVYPRDGGWWWNGHLPMPYHHATRIEWTNVSDFPSLTGSTTPHRFTFVMDKRDIVKVPKRREWRATYYARILRVEPL